jgi:hypothetical protein
MGVATSSSVDLFDPATLLFSSLGSTVIDRAGHSATLLPSGDVLIAGGSGSFGFTRLVEIFNPATGEFERTGDLVSGRAYQVAVALPNGSALLAGGINDSGFLATTEIYQP